MSDRIEEIRAHLKLLERPHSIRINVTARPPTADIAGVGAAYVSAPSDIAFLLAEVEHQSAQLARIKAALLHAGCSDYTDDVARMAEEFLAQGEEG